MVTLYPRSVTINTTELQAVESVVVSRTAARVIAEHSDLGPFPAFIDVPERRVTIAIRRAVHHDEPSPARPGDSVTITFRTAESAAAPRARQYTAAAVVTAVTHDVSPTRHVIQTITALAWSTDGAADPVTETTVPG